MNKMLLAAICAILSFAGLGGEALQAQQLNGSIYLDGKLVRRNGLFTLPELAILNPSLS